MKTLSYMPAARRRAMETAQIARTLTDEAAMQAPSFFMPWRANCAYAEQDRVRFAGELYKCLRAHTSQETWKPDAARSLWIRIDDPSIEYPAWRQPEGAQDAYALHAKVTHKGGRWISALANNVWEPGVYGWENAL